MSILDSHVAPYLIILSALVILAGVSRRFLLKLILVLLFEIILFACFPWLLVNLASLVGAVRSLFG